MAKNKTEYTNQDVATFIENFVDNEQKKADSFALIDFFEKLTGEAPRMWGPSIIGFGNYHYKYASGHEGDAPMLSFSPRKTALTFYVFSDTEHSRSLLENLGQYKMSKACIYVKKLADIDMNVLKEICNESIEFLNTNYECSCHKK